jgi:hypothetical protein
MFVYNAPPPARYEIAYARSLRDVLRREREVETVGWRIMQSSPTTKST